MWQDLDIAILDCKFDLCGDLSPRYILYYNNSNNDPKCITRGYHRHGLFCCSSHEEKCATLTKIQTSDLCLTMLTLYYLGYQVCLIQ